MEVRLKVFFGILQKLFRGFSITAAVRRDHLEIFEMLLKAGASQTACEEALLEASYAYYVRALVTAFTCRGFTNVLDSLLKCEVDVNAAARVLLKSSKPSLHTNIDCSVLVAVTVSRQVLIVRLPLKERSICLYYCLLGEDAKLALPETVLAIISRAGGTKRLSRLVGKPIAKEIMFTDRKISAKYALSIDQELLQTLREFHACKQEEGQSVSSYVLKIKSYIDNLERLGHAMTQNLSVSLILVSLRKEYDGFVQNYNMHSMGKTVTKLHAMLKLHEQTLSPKEVAPALPAIKAGRIPKNQKKKLHKAANGNRGKGKAKMGYAPVQAPPFAPKPKNPSTPKRDNPAKDAICH
ncbi:zinc finger, CCHC-type containing protein [Tanacetum coccineum]